MNIENLTIQSLYTLLNDLKKKFGGSIKKEENSYFFKINNRIGKGFLHGVSFSDDVAYLTFDLTFFKDVTIALTSINLNLIYFAYCTQGSFQLSFGFKNKKSVLKKNKSCVLGNKFEHKNFLFLKKNKQIKTTIIAVCTNNGKAISKNNKLKPKLFKTFFESDNTKNFIHLGTQDLKIAEKIQQLNSIKQKGLVQNLLIKGLVNIILALEIKHYKNAKIKNKKTDNLRDLEVEIIKKISQYINKHLHKQFTIKQLGITFGISSSKLQKGFKLMHGCTVTPYIRNKRIQKAEEYLKNTDMNISEIVYSVGFSSRSYFSKIFKEKYGCSPSEYNNAQKKYTTAV